MLLLGYFLGSKLPPGSEHYFTLIVLAFFFIPGIPSLIHLWRESRHEIWAWFKRHILRRPEEKAPLSED